MGFSGRPRIEARKNTPMNDMPAAIAHTRVLSRFTGMPSVAARSERSALARTAMPISLRRRKSPSPTSTAITTSTEIIVGVEQLGADRELEVPRELDGLVADDLLAPDPRHQQRAHQEQLRDADGRHGEHEARRLEEAADEEELDERAKDHRSDEADGEREQPRQRPRGGDAAIGERGRTVPRSACAKLMTRLARCTSARPSATSEPSIPSTNPSSHSPAGSGYTMSWKTMIATAGAYGASGRATRPSVRGGGPVRPAAPRD